MPINNPHTAVVIGASAGGVQALQQVASKLPCDLAAVVLVVLHLHGASPSYMPEILSRAGPLPALSPPDWSLTEPGRIYVARPDHHMALNDGRVRMTLGPRENLHRPSIDVLFRSAAKSYGPRAIGVLLTGADDDGAAGLQAIQLAGGTVIVQDPNDSVFPMMPLSALKLVKPDYTVPVAEIGAAIAKAVNEIAEKNAVKEPKPGPEPEELIPEASPQEFGPPTAFTCPDCGGSLWELAEGDLVRYRCRVGHAYSPASMLDAESDRVERALWSAVRTLKESAELCRRVAKNTEVLRTDFEKRAEERETHAKVIQEFLHRGAFES